MFLQTQLVIRLCSNYWKKNGNYLIPYNIKLTSLPEGMGGLTSLQTLDIWDCPKLKSLPEGIQGLTSLHTLDIQDCPKLKSLHEGIQGLTSLNTLQTTSYPILLKRCKRETGKDWPKIAHIPNLKGEIRQQQTEVSN